MDELSIENKKWFALYTKPRQEFKAATELRDYYIEYFLPTINVVKQWSDRKKKVEEPLFRGYVFIKADKTERLQAVELKSIVKTIFFDGKPAVIPEWQIESMKKMLNSNAEIFLSDKLEIGTRIKVNEGPFAGVEGVVFNNDNNEQMLAVAIEMINRSVIVHLPSSDVAKVK